MNSPDLVLFVGEALVGNEAVDQLVKFNRALIDHADPGQTQQDARTIDGILLTKFDTIDDKVREQTTLNPLLQGLAKSHEYLEFRYKNTVTCFTPHT